MIAICKYVLRENDHEVVNMPLGAEILTVGVQNNQIVLWARVDTAYKLVPRPIYVCFTGVGIPEYGIKYIGTVMISDLVYHVFDDVAGYVP